MLQPELIFALIVALLGLLFIVFINRLYRHSLASSDMEAISRMSGITFEKFLVTLFEDLGYKVQRTPDSADFGADLLIKKDGPWIAVQAKRYKKNVSLDAVQQAVAAKRYYRCSWAMVVTNSRFTSSAWKLAKANKVHLWDERKLRWAIKEAKKKKRK